MLPAEAEQRARKAAAKAARISAKVERAEAGDEEFTEDVDRESVSGWHTLAGMTAHHVSGCACAAA
jgi:hypothetical protein